MSCCCRARLQQRQDARELLLPRLSNLAMCCVKMERYREGAENGAAAVAPGIVAKAALRAAQAARALEDVTRTRCFLSTTDSEQRITAATKSMATLILSQEGRGGCLKANLRSAQASIVSHIS